MFEMFFGKLRIEILFHTMFDKFGNFFDTNLDIFDILFDMYHIEYSFRI